MRSFLLMAFMVCFYSLSFSQAKTDDSYTAVITQRAEKIVEKLGISDTAVYARTREIIVNHYRNLNNVYNDRDAQKEAMKTLAKKDKVAADSGLVLVNLGVESRIGNLHQQFLLQLNSWLKPEQVDGVKNGLTYGVVPLTYQAYQDMIPTLTEPQKAQILAWLIEAREHAMDAESSDKKHAWFGKYKGKINNYLSAQGYDSQKERAEWEKRIKAAEAKKQ